ncbi:MAG: glycosyltransferase family 9 protein [Syntrophobacterales bacterium]|jgi:ADP-heptose:LPS heptosyltransferase|nr:glycosyltransferase family 9 protein [Syntrophobacterales bacterium]
MWHKLLSALGRAYLSRRVRRQPPRPLSALDTAKVRRVLLISNTALGDTLFSTPAIRALKERYPDWELEVLAHRVFGDLLAHNPYVARVWTYPGRDRRLAALARRLRSRDYGLVIILHGNDPEATLLAALTGSPFIIGSAKSPLAFAYSAGVGPTGPYEHAIERRLNFVRLVGADTRDKRMDLFLPPQETTRAAAILREHFGEVPPGLMALHPTGSDRYKWWPAASFIELGNWLYRTYQAPLLIISGKGDREAAEAIAAQLSGPSLVTGGRYPLLTVAALLARCRLLVANDSGPLHMGLALGVPSIGLIGADDPRRVGPYEVEWGAALHKRREVCELEPCRLKKCHENRCLTAIQVSEVEQLIGEWWEPRWLSSER